MERKFAAPVSRGSRKRHSMAGAPAIWRAPRLVHGHAAKVSYRCVRQKLVDKRLQLRHVESTRVASAAVARPRWRGEINQRETCESKASNQDSTFNIEQPMGSELALHWMLGVGCSMLDV